MAVAQTVENDLADLVERLGAVEDRWSGRRRDGEFFQALCSSAFMSLTVVENARGGTLAPSP